MKHVNDEFWQKFGPGDPALRAPAGQARLLHVRRGRFDDLDGAKASRRTTRRTDKVQAVLDFPFQDAARSFASEGLDGRPTL